MKYLERKILGHTIRLREADFTRLLNRFDPTNATHTGVKWTIHLKCPLCDHRPNRDICHNECPFQVINYKGCTDVIKAYAGSLTMDILGIGADKLYWYDEDDKEARKRLRRIREEFWKFKEVT